VTIFIIKSDIMLRDLQRLRPCLDYGDLTDSGPTLPSNRRFYDWHYLQCNFCCCFTVQLLPPLTAVSGVLLCYNCPQYHSAKAWRPKRGWLGSV